MEPITLATAAVTAVVTATFSKLGEPLGKGVASSITNLLGLIKKKLGEDGTDGLLLRVEKDPLIWMTKIILI
jgi:hypothetical protein